MARIQYHHIQYGKEEDPEDPEWGVELGAQQHRTITTIQNTKGSPAQYARLTNFLHAVTHEWNRMRRELETEMDLRTKNPKKRTSKQSVKERELDV